MNNQINVSQLSMALLPYKVLFKVKKINVRFNKTLKLKFILIFFFTVYPTSPFDTVTKYKIYSLPYWWKDYSNEFTPYLIGGKIISKMPYILPFEIE